MENSNLNNFLKELNNIKTDEDYIEIKNLETLFSDEYVKNLVDNNININDLSEETFKDSVLEAFDDNKGMQDLIKDSYALIINTLLCKRKQEIESRLPQNPELQQKPSDVQTKPNAGDSILPGQGDNVSAKAEEEQEEKSEQEKSTSAQKQQTLEPVNQNTATMLAINKEDIVNENNAEIARLIMNMKTDNGLNCVRMSEAMIMNDIIEKQNEEIEILRADKNNLMTLIEGSTAIMRKNNDLKERQFKQTAKEINSRTNITKLHVEISKPIIPNKVDFTQLKELMYEAEAEFNTQYDAFENILENANSDLNALNDLYTKNIKSLKKFRE